MLPVGVGGLDDQGVDRARRRLGVAHDGKPAAADVAGEHQPLVAAFGDPKIDGGRAQDVAGLEELERQVLPEIEDPAIGYADHEVLHRDGVPQRVERLALGQRLAVALEELVVLLLDVPRIGQHDRAQVAGGGGAVHRAVEPLLDQERQPAGVVDVRVTQHHAIDPPGIEGQPRVQRVGLGPAALEQPGVEQDPGSRGLEQVHRAGDLAGGAPEGQSGGGHGGCWPGRGCGSV